MGGWRSTGLFIMAYGALFFPIGIFRFLVPSLETLMGNAGIFAGVGWAIYLVVHLLGMIWPKRSMLLLLILLLVVNLAGCQLI